MSIKVTSYVWEHSKQSGAALLLLLAIADFADDDGGAFPGMDRLARKARTGHRNAQKLSEKLVAAGELVIEHNQGALTAHGHTNRFTVVTPWNRQALKEAGLLGVNASSSDERTDTPRDERTDTPGVNASSSKPSVEPSVEPSVNPKRKKRIAIGNSEKDALILAWAKSLNLKALEIGAELCTAARRKRAAEMLRWPTPVTPDEVRQFVSTRKPDYEFCFLPNDLSKERARAVPYPKVKPAQPQPEPVVIVTQTAEQIRAEVAAAKAAFLRGAL